ncbi:hypothetical protein CF70_017885 [Cupriavidus sp. SK-3]|uniref:hypothetical protein n=1 Tax=Cupriavidus sp. SK-3 TaxID=1470558 RepID=UPI0004473990|nr:hypothetical protein [Cupriavidus sp. SK-3]KDP84688.1 hypothetical protein CF70_017885 [Cupriavidus sp. SK-3]
MTAAALTPYRSARRSYRHLRRPKPLTRRELEDAIAKIKARIFSGGEPFGVFVLKHGRGRRVTLLSVQDPNYRRQLRAMELQRHYIITCDKDSDLMAVWKRLCDFDREQPA